MLTRLVYHSENHLGAKGEGMIAGLNGILAASQRNNEKAGLTGALMFDTLWFVQILEGEREQVSATLGRIASDKRHSDIVIMHCVQAEQRLFGNWWMGFAMLRGDHGALLQKHGIGAKFDPRKMTGDQTVALALDLSARGLDRKAAA